MVAQARLMRWAESAAPALPSGAGAVRRHFRWPSLAREREDVERGLLAIRCARQAFTG